VLGSRDVHGHAAQSKAAFEDGGISLKRAGGHDAIDMLRAAKTPLAIGSNDWREGVMHHKFHRRRQRR
jgi:hypothetical protein